MWCGGGSGGGGGGGYGGGGGGGEWCRKYIAKHTLCQGCRDVADIDGKYQLPSSKFFGSMWRKKKRGYQKNTQMSDMSGCQHIANGYSVDSNII